MPAQCRRHKDAGSIQCWQDPLEKEIATHSSILDWEIPGTEKPGGLQSIGLKRDRHNWACTYTRAYIYVYTHTHTHDLSSPTRDWTCVLCTGKQIFNHWTTREVSHIKSLSKAVPGSHLQEITLIAWTLPLWPPGLLTVVVLTHLQALPWPTFRKHSGFKWEAPKDALCIGSGLSQPCPPLLTSHLLKQPSPALWDDHCPIWWRKEVRTLSTPLSTRSHQRPHLHLL